MKIDLFVFRHGQTDWNLQRRLQGFTDIPLNATGIAQAQCLKPMLKAQKIQVLLSSNLSRAVDTARIANEELKVPIYEFAELRECGLGQAEGLFMKDLEEKFGEDLFQKWLSTDTKDFDFKFPGGESKQEHLKRLVNCIENFARRNPKFQRIGVATHGGSLRRLIHHCSHAPQEPAHVPNCVLYHMSMDLNVTQSWMFHSIIEN